MATLKSYDLNGKKLSFANWVSNLSPEETPFVSMTGKESVQQVLFQWQNTALQKAGVNSVREGSAAKVGNLRSTTVRTNVTQILRKVIKISSTANALSNYGRGQELQYQMEKAGKEIKRDLEFAFLNNHGAQNNADSARITAGFTGLVAPKGVKCPETGAIVHHETAENEKISEKDIFNMTMNLYVAGSDADTIMFHPKHASMFAAMQEKAGTRVRMFENTPKVSIYVSEVVDSLGRRYKLIPNRWMPESKVFFFNASDFTQMILRAPSRTQLAKDGSYEKWMLEMEVGLRLRHPFSAGILEVKGTDNTHTAAQAEKLLDNASKDLKLVVGGDEIDMKTISSANNTKITAAGGQIKVKYKTAGGASVTVSVLKDGAAVYQKQTKNAPVDASAGEFVIPSLAFKDAGLYSVQLEGILDDGTSIMYVSGGLALTIGGGNPDENNVQAPV